MKLPLLALLPAVLAAPARVDVWATLLQTTDRYLFSVSLPSFLSLRAAKEPRALDWSSDGCTMSPGNPFGFPFTPACQRHDFGYRNYKAQKRFGFFSRQRIDDNFLDDLNFQCTRVSAQVSCEALAGVYYIGVRMFGGELGVSKRDDADVAMPGTGDVEDSPEALIALYRSALEKYRQAVKEDQEKGLLPQLSKDPAS